MSTSFSNSARKAPSRKRSRRRSSSPPEARETTSALTKEVRKVARRKLRSAKGSSGELELFPRPEQGPVRPGNRCLAEIADLEERFAAGELTWHDYSERLRELAPHSEST